MAGAFCTQPMHQAFVRILQCSLAFGAGFYICHLSKAQEAPLPTSSKTEISDIREHVGAYQFISPFLECAEHLGATTTSLTLVYQRLNTSIKNAQQASGVPTLSVYFRDFDNGPWFGLNEDQDFAPASLMKVPVMMAVFKIAEADPTFLKKVVRTPPPEQVNSLAKNEGDDMVQPDTEYSINELVRYMVTRSDNLATQTILEYVPPATVAGVFSNIGVPVDPLQSDLSLSTKEYAAFFRVLYNASFLTNEYSEKALTLLSESTFTHAIIAGVPAGVPVAHKWGIRTALGTSTEQQVHDCGIVYYPKHPYLLCVMTRGSDPAAQATLIETISGIVYAEITPSTDSESAPVLTN